MLERVGDRPKIELHGYPPMKGFVNGFCSLRKKDCSGIRLLNAPMKKN